MAGMAQAVRFLPSRKETEPEFLSLASEGYFKVESADGNALLYPLLK